MKLLFFLLLNIFALPTTTFSQTVEIEVATVNGQKVYLEEVMRLVEQLPQEFKKRPLETYFKDIVNDIIDTKLASKEAKTENLMLEPKIAKNMEIASNRVLAEAWISKNIKEIVTEETILSAYETFIADIKSREEISVKHILVKEKEEAEKIILEIEKSSLYNIKTV